MKHDLNQEHLKLVLEAGPKSGTLEIGSKVLYTKGNLSCFILMLYIHSQEL